MSKSLNKNTLIHTWYVFWNIGIFLYFRIYVRRHFPNPLVLKFVKKKEKAASETYWWNVCSAGQGVIFPGKCLSVRWQVFLEIVCVRWLVKAVETVRWENKGYWKNIPPGICVYGEQTGHKGEKSICSVLQIDDHFPEDHVFEDHCSCRYPGKCYLLMPNDIICLFIFWLV